MLIGYLRSRAEDTAGLALGQQALADARCVRVLHDALSGRGWEQPALRALLGQLGPGDLLVVPELSALGRSLPEVVRRMQAIAGAGAGLHVLDGAVDTTTAAGRAASVLVGHLAALDRGAARERVSAGLAAARAKGQRVGRRPKLSASQRLSIADAVLSGHSTAARMARLHNVSEATISRLVAVHRVGVAGVAPGGGGAAGELGGVGGVSTLPAAALGSRIAIVGTSGSGKTYAAKGLAEQVMARGGRVCVVDPLGVWWGLRHGADGIGSAPPFPVVVFGGPHGHVPLDVGMGAALGRLVGTRAMACVVDVSELGSSAARRAFMAAFTEALYLANMAPLHLVLDEADLWAPQRVGAGGRELLNRVEEIVRRGRVRGFVPWLLTQRPAVLHKDVLSQADVLVSMKLTSSQDREAVGRWIEGQADRADGQRILGALPRLNQGEGYVWAPSQGVLARVQFPRIQTLDSSGTPQRAETADTGPRALPMVDLEEVKATLGGRGGR